MAVSLVGEVVNTCDAVTGFSNSPNISGDDAFVEGTGAIGKKVSNTTTELYTTTLGATAPYNFSSGGGEEGYHIIMWFNAKTPVNATTGFRITVGNGTDRGHWYVPESNYTGGYVPKVVDSARNFDNIAAGTWTVGGNPAQLSNVTQMGGTFTTITSIMGSFNNTNLDAFTIGLGLRADAGTIGTPNTFETVRAADESGTVWGWWTSKNGAFVGKGKLYIGPATGSATSVFTDSSFAVVFAEELVAAGFYEIAIRGTATDVSWTLGSISAADATVARWGLTVDSTTQTFEDTNGIWQGGDQLVLNANSTLTGTTLVNCSKLTQTGATLDGITVLNANTADGVAFLESDNPALISNSSFTFSDGHAIEITAAGTYTFNANVFTGYGITGGTDAAIYNTSSGDVILNVTNGGTVVTYRNAGIATTTVNLAVVLNVTVKDTSGTLLSGVRVAIFTDDTGETELMNELTNGSGLATESYAYTIDQSCFIRVRAASGSPAYKDIETSGLITNLGLNVQITLEEDINV